MGGCPMRRGVYFVGGGHFILCPFSHFEMQVFKNSKYFFLQHPQYSFSDLRQMQGIYCLQVDIDLTLNLNFLFQRAVSFHPSLGTKNQPNP